jgi:hypothetical protein
MPEPTRPESTGRLDGVSASDACPTVVQVLRFEDLPLGSHGTRRAVVRWSDGSEGEGLRWYADLCGHPHKSSYAEACVMPRDPRIAVWAAERSSKHRHNSAARSHVAGDCRALTCEPDGHRQRLLVLSDREPGP